MSLKRHWQKCNTVKSGRRWRRRPWRFRSERSKADRLADLELRFMAQEHADYYADRSS